jgi:hypothetical protein
MLDFLDNLEGWEMALNNRSKLGITVAIAVLAGLTSVWIAVPLLVLAALLIARGQAPERTEAFVGRIPGGNSLLKALARIDLILWPPDLGQKDLVQEDLQVALAQEDKGDLVQEEYFRAILRGYSPLARRNLRHLRLTGNPKSVLEEEWEQYFQDGIVEGGVRPEWRELIGRLLDEFQDTP